MKEKLKNDLKFLRPWWVRLILSTAFSLILVGTNQTWFDGGEAFFEYPAFWWLSIITFIGLYFFVAWLYGNE